MDPILPLVNGWMDAGQPEQHAGSIHRGMDRSGFLSWLNVPLFVLFECFCVVFFFFSYFLYGVCIRVGLAPMFMGLRCVTQEVINHVPGLGCTELQGCRDETTCRDRNESDCFIGLSPL